LTIRSDVEGLPVAQRQAETLSIMTQASGWGGIDFAGA